MRELLRPDDGWYAVKEDPQQHYFFHGISLCSKYKTIPKDAHHDNNPLVHCKPCEQKINKLLALASSIVGKKITPRDMFLLIENLDKIKLNKGLTAKEKVGEGVTAIVQSQKTGKKKTYDNKPKAKTKKKSHSKK